MKVRLPWWAFGVVAVWLLALLWVPVDVAMGEPYRLIYIHVPFALVTYLGTLMGAGAAALHLWRREAEFDRLAQSFLEPATLLAWLTLWTGSLWGRMTWNAWWTWDARLTSMLVLFLLLAGTHVLRDLAGGGARGGRLASVAAVAAAFAIPVVHMSVYWWVTLHQKGTILVQDKPKMDAEMLWVLLAGVVVVAWWLFATARARAVALKGALAQ